MKVACTTNTNLGTFLNIHKTQKLNKYDNNVVYQIKYPTCHKKYLRQTGRHFRIRFRELYDDYKYANNRYNFAQHLIDEG
jgi:hypothetical protein